MPPKSPPSILQAILRPLASLKLTVALLAYGIVLIFLATIDQVHLGILEAVENHLRTFVGEYTLRKGGGYSEELGRMVPPTPFLTLYYPGGYALGALLLANLLAAHITRFKLSWQKSGIFLVHLGIILLLLGELFTGLFAREMQMSLDEGETSNFSTSNSEVELALVDTTEPGRERHIAIPMARLRKGASITHPELPFRVEVIEFLPNAALRPLSEPGEGWQETPADRGIGPGALLARLPEARSLDETNIPAVLFRLHDGSRTVGTWLGWAALNQDQRARSPDGRQWDMRLRFRRDYKPFSITLRDFRHDRYPGTDIPKDFSSFITLTSPEDRTGRDIRIYMNHPLRHGGYTFYQHQFANNDRTSILLVVANPTWLLPYISCVLVMAGLTVQFTLSLARHRRKSPAHGRSTPPATPPTPDPAPAPAPAP